MATQTKKAAPKVTSHEKPRISAIETQVHTTDQFVQAGTEAVRDFIAAGTEEAQRAQAKVLSASREQVEKWASTADQSARAVTEFLALGKDSLEAYVESGKIITDLSKELQEDVVASLNENFARNVELAKDLLACRTVNDLVEIQNRSLQANINQITNATARWSDMWFKLTTEAAEPLNAQVAEASQRISKTLAA